MRESEVVLKFFAVLDGQKGTVIRYEHHPSFNSSKLPFRNILKFLFLFCRSSEEEKLKNVTKVAEILSGKGNGYVFNTVLPIIRARFKKRFFR